MKIARPFPPGLRAFLRGIFYEAGIYRTDGMRYYYPNSAEQLQGLADLVAELQVRGLSGEALEVGSHSGESTEFFAKQFRVMHAVDPWIWLRRIESAFDKRMRPYPHVRKWKMMSTEAALKFADRSLDFVYIDADHRYESVCQDIGAWLPKIRKGGCIAGHDFCEEDVSRAVHKTLGTPDRLFQDSSWLKEVR